MAAVTADERNARTVNTAACLIIGDEVLGGKVCACSTGTRGGQWLIRRRLLM